jgi:hypothetical protein
MKTELVDIIISLKADERFKYFLRALTDIKNDALQGLSKVSRQSASYEREMAFLQGKSAGIDAIQLLIDEATKHSGFRELGKKYDRSY